MTTGNFWDTEVWSFIITITILLVAMMVANMLRRTIKPLRKMLIPSSVLGGFLLLFVNFVYKQIFNGESMFSAQMLESITYHGLGLGFVAMSLRQVEKNRDQRLKSFDTGVMVVGGYLVQAVLGLSITTLLFFIMKKGFAASGLLLPMGFGQGPGQAYNWGRTYENLYGFAHGTSFGLTVAAMGFVAASVGGIVYLNVLRRKGRFKGTLGAEVSEEEDRAEAVIGKNEIPLSESLDKLTVQVALVFGGYIMAYLIMLGINAIINTGVLGDFGYNTVQPLVWGFNFLFGTICALILKGVLGFFKKKNVIHREYTSNFMQSRIAGFMFDIMVVASIAAIDLSAFTHVEFIVPLSITCIVGGIATYLFLAWLCPIVYPDYSDEAFLSLYGMLTGTASTGVILLREKDPHFDTPAANNLVYQQPWAIAFGFPMLLMLGFAPKGTVQLFATIGVCAVLLCAMIIILLRRKIFKKK
ncbi:MAG: hypothetical protein IKM29_02235 [Clostridia bacterium]|nr:hypothetical protein [Clostridia bacterium]